MKRVLTATAASVLALGVGGNAHGQTEIQWWHAMGGELGDRVEALAEAFNDSQSDFEVQPVYRGNYSETMTAAIAAFRAGEQPHIVQVFEVGTASMMAAEGAIYSVQQMMEDVGEPFDPSDYLSAVTGYYSSPEGEILSLPFNSSTPVLYYNKQAFEEAGLDPEQPPRTWHEMADASQALLDAGYSCGFTTGWQSWVQIENFSAWHNVPLGTHENGFASLETELTINNDLVIDHIANMSEWQDQGIFAYGGRRSEAMPMFTNAECAMYTDSSASFAGIAAQSDFEFGMAMLPHYPEVEGAPQNSIIGGATLWVLSGHEMEEYEGVARFFTFLSSPEVQAQWHQDTGYVPITLGAYELSQEQGFYDANPGTDIAIQQLNLNEPTENSRGLRFGNFVQIRDIINEELESVWSGDKSAEQALDDATQRANDLIRRFEDANS